MGKIKMCNLKNANFCQTNQSMHIFSGHTFLEEQKCIYKKIDHLFFSWCYITSATNKH